MKLLTGNDLKSGAVVWWTGVDWSLHVDEAVDAGERAGEIASREEATRRVNAPYVIDAELRDGRPRPLHIKDRIRALGPTVRPDLAVKPADPEIGTWII